MLAQFFSSSVRSIAVAATAAAVTATAAFAQAVPVTENAQRLLDREDTVFMMLDHQAGLMQIVNDIDQTQLRRNVAAKGMVAEYFDIPVIASTSVPSGPNGPLIAEVTENAPSAVVIYRAGPINAAIRPGSDGCGRNPSFMTG